MQSLAFKHRLLSWGYFTLLVVLALILYKDYGLAWDEPVQRNIGCQAVKYVEEGDRTYMQMHDKIYGVGFEIPMILLERFFDLKDSRDIFLFRHLFNVLFFAFACFIFFRMNLKLFQKFQIAIIPTLVLILSPRIFGHSFFNSKDIPFLSMYIISFYALLNYLLKPGYIRLLIMAICSGLLINFRIMGVLFFVTALFCMLVYIIQKKNKHLVLQTLAFILIAALSLYGTWPYLWEKPFYHFQQSFLLMSKFPWIGSMLFRGEVIQAGAHLSNYLFTWMGITIPILYLVMAGLGGVLFLLNMAKSPKKIFDSPIKLMGWVFMVNVITPVAAVLFLKSILYDDWRQLYFIYPGMVVFTGYLFYYLKNWKPKLAQISFFICLIYMGYIGFQMVKLHPYEQVYFNELVSHRENYLQQNYDGDYWGTCFYEGLAYIAKNDPSDTITIFTFHDALRRNAMLLPEKDRKRFIFLQKDEQRCKYYLTTFRFDYPDLIGTYHYKSTFYEIKRQNSVILKIWQH